LDKAIEGYFLNYSLHFRQHDQFQEQSCLKIGFSCSNHILSIYFYIYQKDNVSDVLIKNPCIYLYFLANLFSKIL